LSPRANYTDRAIARLSTKLVPTLSDRGCHMVSVTDPYVLILDFLDRSHYFLFQIGPQLYSRGWVDTVPGPLLHRQSDSAGNRTGTSRSVGRNSDHYTIETVYITHAGFPILYQTSSIVWGAGYLFYRRSKLCSIHQHTIDCLYANNFLSKDFLP
jgi:hypothetical protein